MYIIEFENGGRPYWITEGEGDPPRTVVEKNARRFDTKKKAERMLRKVIKNCPWRYTQGESNGASIVEVDTKTKSQ